MIKASLKEFFHKGMIGPIELGISQEKLQAFLGAADHVGGISRRNISPTIFKYGDIEFHFEDDFLSLIFMDDFDVPSGGRVIELDPWIVKGGLAPSEMEQRLDLIHITHERITNSWSKEGYVNIIVGVGVVMSFVETVQEYGPRQGLYSISFKK